MNHFDNGPQELEQEEQSEQAHTPHDGPQERNIAILHFQDGAVVTSITKKKRRSSRLQSNAASASRGPTSGSSKSRRESKETYSSDVSIWSSDRLSEIFMSQPNTQNGYHRKTPSRETRNEAQASHANESLESLVSKFMQVALVFNLAVGSSGSRSTFNS